MSIKKILLTLCSALPLWACVPVEGDRITGKDLAAARPEFATIDAAAEIGLSPRSGVTRVLQAAELAGIARKFGITANGWTGSACFVRTGETAVNKPEIAPPDVRRGEKVAVEVTSGAARLWFEANAESAGHAGDPVLVRNPENGKLFQARVASKGKVMVQR